MAYENETVVLAQEPQISFETVLDETCRILESKQVQHSIKRIREFDERLGFIEKELDAFIGNFEVTG